MHTDFNRLLHPLVAPEALIVALQAAYASAGRDVKVHLLDGHDARAYPEHRDLIFVGDADPDGLYVVIGRAGVNAWRIVEPDGLPPEDLGQIGGAL